MSGGSFNYLCHAFEDELFKRDSDLAEMAVALNEYPDGGVAARETEEIRAFIRAACMRVEVRSNRLREVWKAVEWHHSNDSGPDRVAAALKAYHGEPS